jgi:hypothetical protein
MEYFSLSAGPNTDLWRKPPDRDTATAPIVYTSLRQPFIIAEVTVTAEDWLFLQALLPDRTAQHQARATVRGQRTGQMSRTIITPPTPPQAADHLSHHHTRQRCQQAATNGLKPASSFPLVQ